MKNSIDLENSDAFESVVSAVIHLASEEKKDLSKFIIVVSILFLILGIFWSGGWLFPTFFVPVIYIGYLYTKAKKLFMKKFAETNNLDYKESIPVSEVKGNFFELGHSRKISNVVTGIYKDKELRLFNFSYAVGSGKHQRTFSFTIVEIIFQKINFPHIILQSKTMSRFSKGDNQVKISLEKEFEDYFDLYCEEDYEIEALEIFKKEMLRDLISVAGNYSIELFADRLYVYDDLLISNRKELEEIYSVTKKIYDSVGSLLHRMKDDFDSLHTYYRK